MVVVTGRLRDVAAYVDRARTTPGRRSSPRFKKSRCKWCIFSWQSRKNPSTICGQGYRGDRAQTLLLNLVVKESCDETQSSGVYTDRALGSDRYHRGTDWPAAACCTKST